MNRLLGLLDYEKDRSVARLKRIYRALCKRTHPDLSRGPDAGFVELRREYEEALRILAAPAPAGRPAGMARGPGAGSADPRTRTLRLLYLYAVRFYGSDSGRILASLTEACRAYDPGVHAVLLEYRRVFFDGFADWRRSGPVYYTHNLLIASIMQLFYHFSFSPPRHGTLLAAYLGDMGKRAGVLSQERRRVLASFGAWLLAEAGGEKVKVL